MRYVKSLMQHSLLLVIAAFAFVCGAATLGAQTGVWNFTGAVSEGSLSPQRLFSTSTEGTLTIANASGNAYQVTYGWNGQGDTFTLTRDGDVWRQDSVVPDASSPSLKHHTRVKLVRVDDATFLFYVAKAVVNASGSIQSQYSIIGVLTADARPVAATAGWTDSFSFNSADFNFNGRATELKYEDGKGSGTITFESARNYYKMKGGINWDRGYYDKDGVYTGSGSSYGDYKGDIGWVAVSPVLLAFEDTTAGDLVRNYTFQLSGGRIGFVAAYVSYYDIAGTLAIGTSASGTTPPPDDGGTTPPSDGGGTTPPPDDGGGTTPPSDGGGTTPPPDDGGTTPPSDGGGTTPPSDGGGTTPPSDGGGVTPPSDSGGTSGTCGTGSHTGCKGPTDCRECRLRITTQPVPSVALSSGKSATLKVAAVAGCCKESAKFGYQWYKDGAAIGGATKSSYTIKAAKGSDAAAGVYYVIVSNLAGTVTSDSSFVNVLVSPAIAVQPASQSASADDDVEFSVGATGTDLNYQWKFNGKDIPGANDATLVVSAAAATAGKYTVVVSNAAGSIASKPATLSVLTPPEIVKDLPDDVSVAAGKSVTLSVKVTGSAKLTYQWYRDNDEPIAKATGTSYQVKAAKNSDAAEGYYYVVATNPVGEAVSNYAYVSVLIPIAITEQPGSASVLEGEDVTFHVAATGSDPIEYQWKFNGKDIEGADDDTLVVTASAATNGKYTVVVSNPIGSVTSKPATLKVDTTSRSKYEDEYAKWEKKAKEQYEIQVTEDISCLELCRQTGKLLKEYQEKMKKVREEAASKRIFITPSYYETVVLDRRGCCCCI
ncbi:MAG: immunoglobulin domain-containing protein [Puniceicoccales bacterium]|nr:immunoglobulin domain-containing protein [Puniceicoccales bacterium]